MKTLITGYAGSGKTTYIKQNYENVLYHDEWALKFRQRESSVEFIESILDLNVLEQKDPKKILQKLIEDKYSAYAYRKYFMRCFCTRVMNSLLSGKYDAIEIPFLNAEVEDLKKMFGLKIIEVQRPIQDCIDHLINMRNWEKEHVKMTLGFQLSNFIEFEHIIDERVNLS